MVPANCTAEIYLPAENAAGITEGGLALAEVEGVELLRVESGECVFEVGSGEFCFEVRAAVTGAPR